MRLNIKMHYGQYVKERLKSAHEQISILGMRHTGRISDGRHDEYAKNFANIQKKGGFVKG